MIPYIIAAIASLAVFGFAVVLITLATRRFLEGDIRSILRWLLVGFWLMALPYTLFVYREVTTNFGDIVISWIIYLSMFFAGLCLLKAAHLIYAFSKNFGFAHLAEKPKKK